MATEEEPDSLKIYWDHFFKAETGTYEKSTWLELFLAEFLVRLQEGVDPNQLIKFCPVSGVVTLVACELLCGIHRVTSAVNLHHAAPLAPLAALAPLSPLAPPPAEPHVSNGIANGHDGGESAAGGGSMFSRAQARAGAGGGVLRAYVLRGPAWRCLVLLRTLGVQGVSCCRQLSSVLAWLWGELACGAASAGARAPLAPLAPRTSHIHTLFSHRIWAKQTLNQAPKTNSTAASARACSAARTKHNGVAKLDSDSKGQRHSLAQSEPSTESADSDDDLHILNKSVSIKVSAPGDFQYFNSPPRSSNDYPNETLYSDPFYTPRRSKPKADDYMNDKHKEIINTEIGSFDFMLLISELLQELCKAESGLTGAEGSQISVQCISFSLKNLCSLQFGSLPANSNYSSEQLSRIKLALTELLIVALDKVLIHSDLCAKLINNGILPMLLRILEDVICKSSAKYNTKDDRLPQPKDVERSNESEAENLLKYVFGIAYSITAFFHCLLMQCRTVDKLREFTDQFKLYGECLKGGLLKECIELMIRIPRADEETSVILIKKLIECIGKLVSGMKRVRSEVIHSAACGRSRHKACRARVAAGMHHHHDVLGEPGAGLPLPAACCVSVLYGTLAALVADERVAAQPALRTNILRVMLGCGVCCCFSPGFLMECIVRLMLTHNGVAPRCLQLLERTVYGDLGSGILIPRVTDQLPCSICEPCDDNKDLGRKYCHHGVSPIERKSVWSFLIHYNSLLQLDNHNNVLHAAVSHLLKVTPKCRMEMKYELLFSVIYPTFIVSKHRYIIKREESAYFLTVSCLNIFASLLNTVSFAEQFIQKGGLSYVLELVSLPEFSNQCCAILEIAIIVEIYKLMKENEELTYYREISSLASVQMLFKCLSEVTDKCYIIYKLQLPADKFEELCDLTREKEILEMNTGPEERVSMSNSTLVSNEIVGEESNEGYIEALKTIGTFWKSCAGLCLLCPLFREHVARAPLLAHSYALLKLALHRLCHPPAPAPAAPADTRLLVALMEALLTVQFAVSDATNARSRAASCGVVRSALRAATAAPAAAGTAAAAAPALCSGAGLSALCDALIGVAVARPSRRLAMPRLAPAKVPPLQCESSGSSAEGSSGEEAGLLDGAHATSPYASELSDPHPPDDDGYEADVEAGKLAAARGAPRDLAHTVSALGGLSEYQSPMEALCGGRAAAGPGLAHPELCLVVVDILSQLVQRVVEEESSNGTQESLERVCGGLARALAARLAGGGAPAGLLRRLLAPPAAALLRRTDPRLAELQHSILELIHVVASQSVEPHEVAALLQLAAADGPPLGALLAVLQRLLAHADPCTPDFALHFPVQPAAQPAAAHAAEPGSAGGGTGGAGAAHCVVDGANWGPWLQGFALVVWLQPLPETKSQEYDEVDRAAPTTPEREAAAEEGAGAAVHVLSLGQESLTFELWLNVATGVPSVRLSRGGGGGGGGGSAEWGGGGGGGAARALCEGSAACRLRPARWSCLALNVREAVLRRRIHIQVTFYLNGRECDTVSLPLQGILVRKMSATSVSLGQVVGAGGAAWRLGPLALYRAPVLAAPAALHLAAHGPDHACQVRCEEPNFSAILTPDVLDMNVDWEQVFEMPAAALRELHDQLLATYSAHAHEHFNLYQQVSAPQTVSGLSARGGGCAGAGVAEALRVQWAAPAQLRPHRGLAPALLLLGGPEILIYLFARVVEAGGSAEQQAAALGVALRAARADARLHAALHARDALSLLPPVLAAPACRVSHHMLKEILDVACTGPLLSVSGRAVRLAARAECALREPRLLLLLLRAWPHLHTVQVSWEVEGGEVTENGSLWALALEAICALLRDGPHRAFNHQQAARTHLLRHLLLACKERFLNSDSGPLSTSASNSLVELVRALVGTPPLPAHLALLCDFLLLMHQASDTFVTHSRANFYFLLTAESPETSEFNFLTFMNKRKNKQHKLKKSLESLVLNDPNEDNAGNEPAPQAPANQRPDHTKEMKGLINAHLRDGRKENGVAKSNGTNGTPIGARGAAGEGGGEGAGEGGGAADALSGYVLVDEDELRHTTVELYTGGIYHQRRVRAGAEPGWTACAGLLLLLRDSLAALPDHLLTQQTVCGPALAESLVVLANHRTACVRAAVVRCVCALQRRAPRALAACAAAAHYYTHLADQISLYPGSWELATACAALLTKCDVPLEDQLDDDIWMELGEEAAQRGAPLLALLPVCLHSVPLAHNVALLLRRLVQKVSLKALTEVALAEVVVRAVREVGRMEDQFEGRDLLLEDLFDLLNKLAVKALANNHTMQAAVDIHQQLRYVCGAARGRGAAAVRRLARAAEAALFAAQLDHLEAHLDHCYASHNKHTNYFANVLGGAESGRARSELCARYSGTLARALAFLLARSPRAALHAEEPLFRRLLDTLLLGASGSGEQRAKWWAGWGAECAAQLQELFWWAGAPGAGARALQPALLRALYRAPRPALAHLAPRDPSGMHKLSAYLLIMLQHIHAAGGAGVELAITDWARDWAVATQAGLPERLPCDALPAEAERFLAEDEERWTKTGTGPRQRAAVGKAVFSREGVAARCTESAMAVTRRVVEAQNAERKQFLEHLRRAHVAAARAAAAWRRLIDAHTHEHGVWHNPCGWPAAWQLDSTEGPGRVRVRLRRAHLRIPARCFQPHARHKAEAATQPGPLRSVLGPLLSGARHGGLAARLQPTESVAFMARVHHVTVDRETSGELLLSDRCIHFVPEWCGEEGAEGAGEGETCAAQSWALGSVARVCPRRWCLQERAAELFLLSGHAHLLAFAATPERDAFLRALDAAHLPNRTEQESLSDAMTQWRNGTITNWEYLMTLNGLAGRSYNDLMQYPVLPFIIADYTSKILDLHDPASFRDLSKPMAVQNKKREQHYINTYNDLKAARREGCSPLLSRQPHHYASLYSNSGGVLHYLVRVPPFTELFLNYQDNNFDMPDRTFHSLATTWRLITHDSPTDVKELIPELFYLPEMFYNDEGLELGVRQCGARVDAVELPRWAADARLFTLAHRQALEAPLVTERLPLWIDLVFGYKQTGQAAVDAINVFPACTYYGFDPSAHEDEVDRTAAQAMVRTYGQAPRQLLRAPHPHAAADLAPRSPPRVLAGVAGVRWGRYCGSPAAPTPAPAARRHLPAAARLVPLPAPHLRAAAACAHHCAPLPFEEGGAAGGGLALLTWGHADGALRLRTRRDAAPTPLLHLPPLEQVTQVSTSCTVGLWSWPAFVGLSSGRVLALRASAGGAGGAAGAGGVRCSVRQLLAHRAPVAALCVCARAALLASADTTGLLLLWDLNRLSYIRTLPNRERLPVTQVAISETLGDVASVHELRASLHTAACAGRAEPAEHTEPAEAAPEDREADADDYERDAPHKYQSLIRVHTVNGRFVGSVKVSEVVTSICYSNAPEGASVNCIAAGLRSGEVRLYSSWDLQPVRSLPCPAAAPAPLLSLSYSEDSLVLFAAHAGGLLVAWETPHARAPPPRIVLAAALL